MLAVVEYEEDLTRTERFHEIRHVRGGIAWNTESGRDGAGDQCAVGKPREIDKADIAAARLRDAGGDFNRRPRLSNATRTRYRNEPALRKQRHDGRNVIGATDERCRL